VSDPQRGCNVHVDTDVGSGPRVKQLMSPDGSPAGPVGVPRQPRTASRLFRFVVGMSITGLRYVTQRVPLYRRDREEDTEDSPDLGRPHPGDPDTIQRADDGVGALFHRTFDVHVTDEELDAEALIARILADPNRVAPTELATFETEDGAPAHDLDVGDELIVRLPGPWNGPVRVVERTPTSFRLATLRGHLEAGEIEFRAGYDDRGFLRFRISTWARSGDRLFDALYERFPIGREMQLHMWSQFCRRVAKEAGGVRMSNVTCTTRRVA
jgi:hypothetical protein